MTQVLIDRATLEQLLEDVLQINREMGKGGAACDISNRAYPPIKRSLDALRAALANAEPTGWQKIETAPATANNVLAFSESGNMKIETGFWLINMLHAANIDGEKCNYTHWMPLPTPPKEQP